MKSSVYIATLICILIVCTVLAGGIVVYNKKKNDEKFLDAKVNDQVCGTVVQSCADYMKVDPAKPYNSVRDKFKNTLSTWNTDQLLTLGHMEAREITSDTEGRCIMDGCVMTKGMRDNYLLPDCGSLKELSDGSCYIGMNVDEDVSTLGNFLLYAHNKKFAAQIAEKERLGNVSNQLDNQINAQNSAMASQQSQINTITKIKDEAMSSYIRITEANNFIKPKLDSVRTEYQSSVATNTQLVNQYNATATFDLYQMVKLGANNSATYMTKRFLVDPSITRGSSQMYLAYKYVYNPNNILDPYSLWMGHYGKNYNTDNIRDPKFILNNTYYRCDKFIDAIGNPSVTDDFVIAVDINKGSFSKTLFFLHKPSDNGNYQNNLLRWFDRQTLVSDRDDPRLTPGQFFTDFSIGGFGIGQTSRWAIVDSSGWYIMAVPMNPFMNSWESKARGIPIYVNNKSVTTYEMSNKSNKEILDLYGCDSICVYIRNFTNPDYFGKMFPVTR